MIDDAGLRLQPFRPARLAHFLGDLLTKDPFGSGAKPSGGRFCPQRAHLISDMDDFTSGGLYPSE
jgi:hypothetical protein